MARGEDEGDALMRCDVMVAAGMWSLACFSWLVRDVVRVYS